MIVDPQTPAPLRAEALTAGYGARPVLQDFDLSVPQGLITSVIGPNGCGKSTLLRALARLLPPIEGAVMLRGEDMSRLRPKEIAKCLGLLPQTPLAPDGLTVADLVARGRHPHQSWIRQWSDGDVDSVAAALARTGVADLADRTVDSLSGGQRQRVWISMVLAQDTGILLLDEPTTYLDLSHALEIMDLLDELHETGRTIVMVLHDLNLATRYSDHLVVMKHGRKVVEGAPADVITEGLLNDVFGLTARVVEDPVGGGPLIVPVGRRHSSPASGSPISHGHLTNPGSVTR